MPTTKKNITDKKRAYNKAYKTDRRIVVYAKDAETKRILEQESERTGKSISDLCEPAIKGVADAIDKRPI